jgi:hypothetical protein
MPAFGMRSAFRLQAAARMPAAVRDVGSDPGSLSGFVRLAA